MQAAAWMAWRSWRCARTRRHSNPAVEPPRSSKTPIAFSPIGQSKITDGADFSRWRFRPGRSRRYQNVRCRCAARVPSRYRTAQIPGNITG
ncbi:hypothetical protein XAC3810_530251 [Xanthomonas citri pv. citri]|uniref:Uncharacterized protein n=1 Tax=Xanthomonas citri pv. citri TaxID=611301 RepID=A0A0U5FKV7_XANCI|nr:hypothetical protein XAC9322_530248 [Xanthomonas citri pv. citri]CEJ46476.1 hypothetical protein XAB3213_3470007 [Xanthomonas citri pv. bilvae]CEE33136.1 hypothetical protein XAC3824_690045 [Xanthomonas citri pv. citri]CEE34337.1 hypothetical protein XAC1083_530224 [Xanthomonas citri pv. citri]CEE43633.1 hypothetical protein XAC3810_530251 [Xanthomonas citri pv. citri]